MNYLIIGASSGIGLELLTDLQNKGHEVDTLSRTQGDCDVCDWETPLPTIDKNFDGFVYLPGTINLKPFKQLTLDDFRHDIEINYLGAARAIQHYLPNIETGAIVLVSSVAAQLGMPYHASIGSAKAAVEGLTRALAAELAPRIRVNAVAPSLTDTPLAGKLLDSETKKAHAAKRHPLQTVGEPNNIASAIAYLLEADWVTGQILHVDGGLSSIRLL